MGERMWRVVRRGALALVWIAAGYYFVSGGEYSVFELRELRAERDSLAARVDSLRSRADSLEARAVELEEDSFAIERTARERYGFIRDGERLYRFLDAGSGEGSEDAEDGGGTGVDHPGTRE